MVIYGMVIKITKGISKLTCGKVGIGGTVLGNNGKKYSAGVGRFDQELKEGYSAAVFTDGQFGHIYAIKKSK